MGFLYKLIPLFLNLFFHLSLLCTLMSPLLWWISVLFSFFLTLCFFCRIWPTKAGMLSAKLSTVHHSFSIFTLNIELSSVGVQTWAQCVYVCVKNFPSRCRIVTRVFSPFLIRSNLAPNSSFRCYVCSLIWLAHTHAGAVFTKLIGRLNKAMFFSGKVSPSRSYEMCGCWRPWLFHFVGEAHLWCVGHFWFRDLWNKSLRAGLP